VTKNRSTSAGETLMPDVLIMSVARPKK